MIGPGVIVPLTRTEWERHAPRYADLSFRQCGAYAEMAARDGGASLERVGVFFDGELLGLAHVRVKRLPLLPLGIAYVSHGPITNVFSPERFTLCVEALRRDYVDRRRLVLRIAPPLGAGQNTAAQVDCLTACRLDPVEGLRADETFVVDLERPLPEIRGSFDKKWLASLRKAEQSGLVVTRSQDPRDFARFETLYDELVQRKGFHAHQGAAFYAAVSRAARPEEGLVAHLAYHDGTLVAGTIGSFVGDTAVLLLAAADGRGRDLQASFLLQWEMVQYAVSTGRRFYDLGGVDQAANPDVYRFKKRLNGRFVQASTAFEAAPDPVRKMALETMERTARYLRARRSGVSRLSGAGAS